MFNKNPNLVLQKFQDIDLQNSFFDSLREDYPDFDNWFIKKSDKGEKAYVTKNDKGILRGFLYLKSEEEVLSDIKPELPLQKRLKVGTFKIDGHGTRLGEYYISKILHEALYNKIKEIYVTVFPKYVNLIKLFERYGFQFYGIKTTGSGEESVYLKNMSRDHENVTLNYPRFKKTGNIYLLGIYPKFHTPLFGDSILRTENPNEQLRDVSYTNSIHKVYICKMKNIEYLKQGDILVIYRTAEEGKKAAFNSVASSVCVVEQYQNIQEYKNVETFIKEISDYSIFTNEELQNFYQDKQYPHIIKMLYNLPLPKRITMQSLMKDCGVPRGYWGFKNLTKEQFCSILRYGGVDDNFIIH